MGKSTYLDNERAMKIADMVLAVKNNSEKALS